MMDRELFRQALEALEIVTADVKTTPSAYEAQRQAITALRERLAQPNEFQPDWDAMAVMVGEQQRMAKRIEELEAQQKPWVKTYAGGKPNYTAPRQWQGLTDEERGQVINANFGTGLWQMAKDIEAKLKEKNT